MLMHYIFLKNLEKNQVWRNFEQSSKASQTTDAKLQSDYLNA